MKIPHAFPGILLFVATLVSVSSEAEAQNPEATTNGAAGTSSQPSAPASRVATLAVSNLREYEAQSPQVKRLLARALALTTLNLSYKYGYSDPKNGGMDCSGTVYYLLNDAGLKDVPRDARGMYKWVWTRSQFRAVNSSSLDSFELAALKPGDLLFWIGTYQVKGDSPVSHVMIYLGINRHSGKRVMVGASDGRRVEGISRYGVSVFDFTLPRQETTTDSADERSRFIGYGSIPGLKELESAEESKK
jgi:cell wall-associated NlpC family hydrolase